MGYHKNKHAVVRQRHVEGIWSKLCLTGSICLCAKVTVGVGDFKNSGGTF